jgi:hypothetical protein
MADSQLSELRNMRVLLEEARVLAHNLAYHRRARLENVLGQALDEVDRQIEEQRREGTGWKREGPEKMDDLAPDVKEGLAALLEGGPTKNG